jgi:orotate phosphoribosyltransferase-like protein
MAKISKNNVYAIKYLFIQGLNAEQMSDELNLSVENIQSVIESENLKITTPSAKDLMINKTAVKKTNSVSIMTQEASMMNDHNRSKIDHKKEAPSHIFNPFKK